MTTERLSVPCQFHEVLKRKAPRGSPGGKDLAAILQCLLLCMVCVWFVNVCMALLQVAV